MAIIKLEYQKKHKQKDFILKDINLGIKAIKTNMRFRKHKYK